MRPKAAIEKFRKICLALPQAEERETWGHPTFRIRDKIFATAGEEAGQASGTVKAPPGIQGVLVGSTPERYFVPAYVGSRGWIGIRLDAHADWEQIAFLVERSFRMTAPKALLRTSAPARENQS